MVLDQNYHKMIDENEIRIKAMPKLMDHTLSKLACNHLKKSVTSLIKSGPRHEAANYPPDFVDLDLVGSENRSSKSELPKAPLRGHTPPKSARSACNQLSKSEASLIKTETRGLTVAYPPAFVELT